LMHARRSAATLTVALLLAAFRAQAADDATLVRVFLKDGTSLVSYGEPARVEGRVVFSMPTASTPNPPLHLVDIALDRVDWEGTEHVLTAAKLVETGAERTSLLSTALIAIERDKAVLPSKWLADTRDATAAALREEARLDDSYRALTLSVLNAATRHAKAADV